MEAFEDARQRLFDAYTDANPKSAAIYDAATSALPGGNTRSVLFYSPFPLSMSHAAGSRLYSADGKEYTDFLGEYTAGLYGHSHPVIKQTIQLNIVEKGLNFGSHHEDEGKLAQLIKSRFTPQDGTSTGMELLRFTNSGTEANLMAISAAKAYFNGQRTKVMVFEGGYHGGVFMFKQGPNIINAPFDWVIARYNDIESVNDKIKNETDGGRDLAVIIVEPMLGSSGAIPGRREFLQHLRSVADETGAILIFDEVMTSRMYAGGGVQTEIGIFPDMTTLGKYIGGGMSFGAFGGRRDIMEQFDPRTGELVHAGTFNNNVLSMSVGRAGLEKIFTPEVARQLHERGEKLKARLNDVAKGTILKVTGIGSIMAFHFTDVEAQDIANIHDIRWGDVSTLLDVFHLELLEKGIYIARRGFVSLSLALEEDDMDSFVNAVKSFVEKYRDSLEAVRRAGN